MTRIVIVFVPAGRAPAEFEEALREFLEAQEQDEARQRAARDKLPRPEAAPMWTWFLPNPCS